MKILRLWWFETKAEELNAIILKEQALPQIPGYTSHIYSIPNVKNFISLNKIFFILGNIKILPLIIE